AIHQDDAPGNHLSVVFLDARIYARTDGALPLTVASLFTALPQREVPPIRPLRYQACYRDLSAVRDRAGSASAEQPDPLFTGMCRAVIINP
ncbi:hypothetical protein, partial [Pectobacterium brasiliense]|uniref:hypothetical protein n=1 Tax=Pectobacterium brasiliense TaxID=180957 RepID=UPI003BF7763F